MYEMGDDIGVTVSQASEGRALRGLSMFSANPTSAGPLQAASCKQLLLNPAPVTLTSCNQHSSSITFCFSGSEESAAFRKDVTDKGWSLATALHAEKVWHDAKVGLAASDHERKVTVDTLSERVSEACVIQCAYIPMKCFQIPRCSMTLSKPALARALAINDEIDADCFLSDFNSHVTESSIYHLGGVFFKEVTVKCVEKTTLSEVMRQAEMKLNTGAGANLPGMQALVTAKAQKWNGSTSGEGSASIGESSTQRVFVFGPTTAVDDKEFRDMLNEDSGCWAIIDIRNDTHSKQGLVSVWELLLDHANSFAGLPTNYDDNALQYKRAAKFLCQRWLDIAAANARYEEDPLYSQLMVQSKYFLSNLAADPIFLESMDQQHAQLVEDMPLPPLILGNVNDEEVSLGDLVQKLERVILGQAELTEVGEKAAAQVRCFIKNYLNENSVTTDKDYKRALFIFRKYGFDSNGNLELPELRVRQLTAMIDDIRGIHTANERILPSASVHDATTCIAYTQLSRSMSVVCTSESASTYGYKYVGGVLVDRDFYKDSYLCVAGPMQAQEFKQAAARRLIDCLRHCIYPQNYLLQLQGPGQLASEGSADDSWDCAFDDEEEAEEGVNPISMVEHKRELQLQQASPLDLLLHIFQASDLPAQIALCHMLLTQRAATLLAVPSVHIPVSVTPPPCEAETGLMQLPLMSHYIEALSFVDVSLEKGKKVCIANDTTLPRVVFLSDKSVQASHAAIVATRVLSCDFISQYGRREMGHDLILQTPVIEVGIGFVSAKGKGSSQRLACLAFHVTGPYLQLMDFIAAIADVVVLELEQGQRPPDLKITSTAKVLQWQETQGPEGSDKRKAMLWGQESYLVEEIKKFLYSASQSARGMQKSARESLKTECVRQFPACQLIAFERAQGLVEQCDFRNIRKSLKLQTSFVEEAQAHFEILQLKGHPAEKQVKIKICDHERENRRMWAKDVMKSPIMQLFYQVLGESDPTSRRVQMMWFQRTLSEKMCPLLEDAGRRVSNAWEACNRDSSHAQAKQEYINAKQEYIGKSLGIDNLWRELCHVFEAYPDIERHLAKKAARHLLDGFPLEILDGDAGMFCKTWVEGVLDELNLLTMGKTNEPAKIFVLSVMGLQSSGKSTILNLMFGASLQTSAGRCTRGVYMQLVPSERAEYNYVLLLDTEGLRSPEFFGLEASEVRDNRLATLGLLPADASIFMVSNEDDSGLKEVLPMVLLAFKGSAMAESCGGRIKAKMVFVYRSVNTNNTKMLMVNKQKLYEYLKEAAKHVTSIGANGSSSTEEQDHCAEADLLQSVFTDFRVHEDEMESDVKCMGNLKSGFGPPDDWVEYGDQVLALREYIHKRVMDAGWESRGFKEWGALLTTVWDCICSANFELSFRTEMEYSSYRELQALLQRLRTQLLEKCMKEFESVVEKVRSMKEEDSSTALINQLEKNVEDLLKVTRDEVERNLEMKRWAKWREKELDKWVDFCNSTKESYKRRVVDVIKGVLGFEKYVTHYEKRIKSTILHMRKTKTWTENFEEIFKKILDEAEEAHPQMANEVPKKVMERYRMDGITNRIDFYGPDSDESDEKKSSLLCGLSDAFKTTILSAGRHQNNIDYQSSLQRMINRQLGDARQYSDVIVDSIISKTNEELDKVRKMQGLSKEEEKKAHIWVKDIVIEKMRHIQMLWDEDYNVAQKLRHKAKPRLKQFFEACAKGFETAALLIEELQSVLEDALEEVHSLLVVQKVAARLGRADHWVMDWRVMGQLLDYHLVTLMENKSIDKLLKYVNDGNLHFQEMTDALIRHCAGGDQFLKEEWEDLVEKVEKCFKDQQRPGDRHVGEFLNGFARRLDADVDSKVANCVLSAINSDEYKDHILYADSLMERVTEMCNSIRKKAPLHLMKTLTERVRKRMVEDLQDENWRPRCGERCPECGSPCFYSFLHGDDQKHDCFHQPAGLGSHKWTHQSRSHELIEYKCYELMQRGSCYMVFENGKAASWDKFQQYHPSWTLPIKNTSSATTAVHAHLREYIFFNYQKELVQFHSITRTGLKPCSPHYMPSHYSHNLRDLGQRLAPRNVFKDDDEWNQFLERSWHSTPGAVFSKNRDIFSNQ